MKMLEASPGALIRGERKFMARRVRDNYSKLKMTYDYLCLVRQARNFRKVQTPKDKRQDSANSPNFLGTQTQTLVPRREPASLNVPCARRNSRDVARQTAPGIHLPHTLSYIALLINTGTSFPDQLTAVTVPLCIMPRSIIDHRAVDRGRRVNPVALDEPPARISINTALTVKPSWTSNL